ncbi:MAG: hypothetical protein R2769_01145 [Saprospiraceae bacterium]
MDDNCLFPIEDGEKIVEGFLQKNLPEEDWTHEAHLIVGLYFLCYFEKSALAEMRINLPEYNVSIGKTNTEQSGYHETMTWFWMTYIYNYFNENFDGIKWNQESLDELLDSELLTERNAWREYYSDELMMSINARQNLVPPDKNPITSIF